MSYDSTRDLRGKRVKNEFDKLCQYSSSLLFDGLGNSIERLQITASYVETSSFTVTHIESSSYAESTSYVTSSLIAANNQTSSILEQLSNMYNCLFINYLIRSDLGFRGGNVVVLYTTSSVNMNETCTTDIGDVSDIHIIANLSSSFISVSVVNNTNSDATIKYHCEKM